MPEIIPNFHPLAVHFPIALIILSAFFHVLGWFTRGSRCGNHCAILGHTTLWLGALAAIPTVLLGWMASNSVNHDEAGHLAMLPHRAWALVTLAVLLVIAGWDALRNKVDAEIKPVSAIVTIAAAVLVGITAWHGGELVYRHGLGVIALPSSEAGHDHHNHDHGAPLEPLSQHKDAGTSSPMPLEEPPQPESEHHHDDGHDHQY
jgi:uncharacterized membrane protein